MSEVITGYYQTQPSIAFSGEGAEKTATVQCKSIYYKQVNETVRAAIEEGAHRIVLQGINGQRYIGDGIVAKDVTIIVEGVAGQDLAMFMGGATVEVLASAQDGVGNTMDSGEVYIHGHAGDVIGYGMRGGAVYIRGDVGYRVGIHMKEFKSHKPLIVAGGCARDFFGEYMAGGELILLGLDSQGQRSDQPLVGNYIGTGMHGGVIYLRGEVQPFQCGKEVGIFAAEEKDLASIKKHLEKYVELFATDFGSDPAELLEELLSSKWTKLSPTSSRPYGNLYAPL